MQAPSTANEYIIIHIVTQSNKMINLPVNLNSTIIEISHALEILNIGNFKIMFEDQELNDSQRSLTSYGINKNSILSLED